MTIGMGDTGFGSFGFSNQGNGDLSSSSETPEQETIEAAEEVSIETTSNEIPGLETSASACFNRANQIARSLDHSNLSIDHLMLALTMEPSARRLLERVGDVAQLREIAMQRLGKNYTRSSRDVGEQPLPPTSDLSDLGKVAREAAAEREQLIAVSDLINAFPKANGRLAYGIDDESHTAVIDSIKNGLVPKVDDAVTRIETAVRDAIQQQHQSVHRLLEDLSSTQTGRAEQQRVLMEDVRRQVREVAESQIGAAVKEFSDRIDDVLTEVRRTQQAISFREPVVQPRSKSWGWLGR